MANVQLDVLQQREAGVKIVWGCRRALRRLWPTMFVLPRTRRARPPRTLDTGEAALDCPHRVHQVHVLYCAVRDKENYGESGEAA